MLGKHTLYVQDLTQEQQDYVLATGWGMEISWAVEETKHKQKSAENCEGMNKSNTHDDSRDNSGPW